MDAPDPDGEFAGASYMVTSPLDLGGGPVTRYHEMLVGSHGGDCYVIHWTPGRGPFLGVLTPTHPCAPAEELTQPGLYVRSWSAIAPESEIRWDAILPPADTHAGWFVPAVIGVMLLVLEGCVGVTLALIGYARRRMVLPDLPIGVASTAAPRVSSTKQPPGV